LNIFDLQLFPLVPRLSETTPCATPSPRTSTLLVVIEPGGRNHLAVVALTIELDDPASERDPDRVRRVAGNKRLTR
jgi:hypothetical protein